MSKVFVDGLGQSEILASDADLTLGPIEGNFVPRGNEVTVTKTPDAHPGEALSC